MKQVAKLVIIDKDDNHLLMYRNQHPVFGNDPDLPGGTLEEGESPLETMLREVYEEIGVVIDGNKATEVYSGSEYMHETNYALFAATLEERPTIRMSWEHSSYEWLDKEKFLEKAKSANDIYMHMVGERLS